MITKQEMMKHLTTARPNRAENDKMSWVDDVADRIAMNETDKQEAARMYLRSFARSVEGQSTKAANKVLCDFHRTGQLPLDWEMSAEMPISFDSTLIRKGKVVTVKVRVKLGHATSRDFELWAETEDKARARDYAARGESVQAARSISQGMKDSGALTFRSWAHDFAPVEESAA